MSRQRTSEVLQRRLGEVLGYPVKVPERTRAGKHQLGAFAWIRGWNEWARVQSSGSGMPIGDKGGSAQSTGTKSASQGYSAKMKPVHGDPKLPKPKADDLMYAYEQAADFLDAEEWPEDDGGAQVAAYREVAKRLRRTVARMNSTQARIQRAPA